MRKFQRWSQAAFVALLVLTGATLSGATATAQAQATPKPAATAAPKATPKPTLAATAVPTAEPTVAATPQPSPQASPSPEATAQPSATPVAEVDGKRSPAVAGLLAVVPGIIVPGTGHFYAGSWRKGLGLLALQAASITIGVSQFNSGYDDIKKMMDEMDDNKTQFPTNVGSAYRTLGVLLVCTSVSLWAWFDDISGAPVAAIEYNKKLEAQAQTTGSLQILPREDGALLAWSKAF